MVILIEVVNAFPQFLQVHDGQKPASNQTCSVPYPTIRRNFSQVPKPVNKTELGRRCVDTVRHWITATTASLPQLSTLDVNDWTTRIRKQAFGVYINTFRAWCLIKHKGDLILIRTADCSSRW
jgi:hypothetical protein